MARRRKLTSRRIVLLVSVVSLGVTILVTSSLYAAMQVVFRIAIDERLMAVASVASASFEPFTLDSIVGADDVSSDGYRQTVMQLRRIRSYARDVKFIYILRRTEDPNTMVFVADADSLTPDIPVDLNGDGTINEADTLTFPGDPYDVSQYPEFRQAAFVRPFVDPEFTVEQWGTLLAGTAPIFSQSGMGESAEYVIGVDLEVTQYRRLLDQVLLPFIAFIAFLVTVIIGQTIALRYFWDAQVKQLEQVDQQKDELLGIVSHQLATPLTAIRWQLETFLDGHATALDTDGKQDVRQIIGTAAGLSDLVGVLLDLSRIELGRLKVDKQPTDLDALFHEILFVAELLAKDKGILLAVNVSKSLPTASIDRRLTRMIFENLLSNAVKYTPSGGTVTFTTLIHDGRLHCEVADTGYGIPQDEQNLLFTKLFRASNVRDKIPGNGFGLYIVKGAVEQQGGTLRCVSELGRGSTFTIELPI